MRGHVKFRKKGVATGKRPPDWLIDLPGIGFKNVAHRDQTVIAVRAKRRYFVAIINARHRHITNNEQGPPAHQQRRAYIKTVNGA